MARDYAYKLIGSSEVVQNLDVDNCIQKPSSEAQARPLTRLLTNMSNGANLSKVGIEPMGSTSVYDNLLPIGNIPSNESQARPLTKLGTKQLQRTQATPNP